MLKKIFNSEIKEIINCLTKIKRSKNKSFKNLCVDAKTSLDNGGKIMFCGNGGSASDAQHLAAELVVKYQKKRKPLAAISLSTDTSVLTATGNDFGFQQIFSRQVEALGKTGDLLICITTSGKSKNIIKAIKLANKKILECKKVVPFASFIYFSNKLNSFMNDDNLKRLGLSSTNLKQIKCPKGS